MSTSLKCLHGQCGSCDAKDCWHTCHGPRAESVLEEAQRIIFGQRRTDYGSPLRSFERIAQGWASILGIEVTAEQVALCMIHLKVCRAANNIETNGKLHRDSIVDIAGYAGCLELIAKDREEDS